MSETKTEDEENNNFCSPDVERTVGNVVAPHLEGKNDVAYGPANNGAGRQSPFAHAWRPSTKPGLMGTCSVVADCLDSKGKRTTCTVLIDTGADLNTAKPRIHQKVEIPQNQMVHPTVLGMAGNTQKFGCCGRVTLVIDAQYCALNAFLLRDPDTDLPIQQKQDLLLCWGTMIAIGIDWPRLQEDFRLRMISGKNTDIYFHLADTTVALDKEEAAVMSASTSDRSVQAERALQKPDQNSASAAPWSDSTPVDQRKAHQEPTTTPCANIRLLHLWRWWRSLGLGPRSPERAGGH